LKDSEEAGHSCQARVVRAVLDNDYNMKKGSQYMKFICEAQNSKVDKMYTYNEILDQIEKDKDDIKNDPEKLYRFRRITAHQGPLRSSDKDYKGSRYNVLLERETGETTYEPLDLIASDDPVTCAPYAKKNMVFLTQKNETVPTYCKWFPQGWTVSKPSQDNHMQVRTIMEI
jgi:hypothetical protein